MFEYIDNIYKTINYIIYISISYLFIKYIFPIFNHYYNNQKNNQKIDQYYIIKNIKKNDNSIYLTQFRIANNIIYLYQFLYGYYCYFFDFINLFCLFISLIQIYDNNNYRSFIPLFIFSTSYSGYYLYTVSKLIKEQNYTNNIIFQNKKLKDIKMCDIIKITKDDKIIPADMLILQDNQHVIVNELQLTGENVAINKTSILTVPYLPNELQESIIKFNNNYNGYLVYHNKKYEYSQKNIIFRGTTLIDGELEGIIIATGNDCMIYNLNTNIIKEKTLLYKKVNDITFDNLYYLLLLATILSNILKYYYPDYKFIILIKMIILLLNTIVPLSLQTFYNIATWIISKNIENTNNIKINSHGIYSFQHNPKYIITDKTGTITKNKLQLSQIINIQNKNIKDITETTTIENLHDVLSCSLINIHSETNDIINNNEMEYLLLKKIIKHNDIKIIKNEYMECKYLYNNNIFYEKRLLYEPFNYDIGIKYSITNDECSNKYYLNIQGTPEMINIYSHHLMDEADKIIKNVSKNSYKRVICYAKKEITNINVILQNKNEIKNMLNNFEYINIYIYEDKLIENLDECFKKILSMNKNLTILTGDRLSSSIEVAKSVGLYNNDSIHIETKDDIKKINLNNTSLFINGKIFDDICHEIDISTINKIIIYRASPKVKENYVEYIKTMDRMKHVNSFNGVMMIGDGSNDISAIMKADIGVGIIGENEQVQHISDIIIDSWNKIPIILEEFNHKRNIMEHIIKWVLSKHIMTASVFLSMMFLTKFKYIKDPSNPYHMLLFNGLLLCYMCLYCLNYKIIINPINKKSYTVIINYSIMIGFFTGIIFLFFNPSNAIIIALINIFINLCYIL